MGKFILILLLLYQVPGFSVPTFDAQNFAQNLKNYQQQLNNLQELKQQTKYHIEQYKALYEQLKFQQINMQKLNINVITELYNNYQELQSTLANVANGLDKLSNLEVKGTGLAKEQQKLLMQQHLQQNIDANKRAINALKILKVHTESRATQNLVNHSQQAAGQMQALQVTNQLLATQIKQLQDLKILMSHDLEQRSSQLAEENTVRQLANYNFIEETQSKEKQYKAIELPKLKK